MRLGFAKKDALAECLIFVTFNDYSSLCGNENKHDPLDTPCLRIAFAKSSYHFTFCTPIPSFLPFIHQNLILNETYIFVLVSNLHNHVLPRHMHVSLAGISLLYHDVCYSDWRLFERIDWNNQDFPGIRQVDKIMRLLLMLLLFASYISITMARTWMI